MDSDIIKQLKLVSEKINKIEKKKPPKKLTSGVFYIDGRKYNLRVRTEIKEVVKLLSQLLLFEESHKQACKILGTDVPLEVSAYKMEDIKTDFINHVQMLKDEQNLNKLMKIKLKYENIMSNEGKRKKSFDELENELENL